MIRAILAKELLEYRRDGRLHGVLNVMLALAAGCLFTAWPTYTSQQRAAIEAQGRDQEAFVQQGDKAPHAAAHFGRMAHKPSSALAMFDPGGTPYLGQVIWLEAHRQDPAMFRPAEDSPELRRLADLSIAGVLTLASPLILCLVGAGVFAGERERGSLRQLMSVGVRPGVLYAGKIGALASVGVAVTSIVIGVSIAVAIASSSMAAAADIVVRGVWLIAAYAAYNVAFAAIVVSISAQARSTAAALMLALCTWAGACVLVPRLAASLAEHLYPTPDAGLFWVDASARVRAQQLERASPEYRSLQREVLSRALGREIKAEEADRIAVNRFGLALEISERVGAKAHAEAYGSLYDTYAKQQRMRRLLALLSPTITLQHASSALAGTDISAHHHFAQAAEQQRNLMMRVMNEDLMLRGAGQDFDYLASAELWRRVPEFVYQTPSASFALRSAAPDLVGLLCWTMAALWVAFRIAARQRAF